jgi:hypothetical protein
MKDIARHQNVTGQVNRQTGGPIANASVFLFFPNAHFLKTNAKHSRAPLENKLNKRVILAHSTNGTLGFAQNTSRHFSKPKEPFFATH